MVILSQGLIRCQLSSGAVVIWKFVEEGRLAFKVAHSMPGKMVLLLGAFSSSPPGLSTGCLSVPISSHQLPPEAIILEGKAKVAMA